MAAVATAALFHFCLLPRPQPHDEGQAKGNDQFQVIPSHRRSSTISNSKISPLSSLSSLRERSNPVSPPPFPAPLPRRGGDGEGEPSRRPLRSVRRGEPSDGRTRDVVFSSLHGDAGINRPVWDITVIHPLPPPFPPRDWKATRSTRDSLAIWMARSSLAYRSFPQEWAQGSQQGGVPVVSCPVLLPAGASPSGPSRGSRLPSMDRGSSPPRTPARVRRSAPTLAPGSPPSGFRAGGRWLSQGTGPGP